MYSRLISFLLLAPLFFPVFTYCPFRLPYLYCFICPARCLWYQLRGWVLLIAIGLNIRQGLFCERICPFGNIQVFLSKIKATKITIPKPFQRLKYLSLVLLILILIATWMNHLFVTKIKEVLWAIFIISLAFSIFSYRFFCYTLCPLKLLSRIKKSLVPLTWALFICIIISGCQGKVVKQQAEYPRIISLAPSITEILFALELEKHIVGITTCCNYPEGTKQIEKIATFSGQANLESILTKEPDFVFSTGLEQSPVVERLKALKINVVLVYPQNLDELMKAIIKIGELTNRKPQARRLVTQMKARINRIAAKVEDIPDEQRPKVFVEISSHPLMTAGCGSFIDEMIKIAGGKNIAYDTERPYSQFSPEIVAKRNPDFILLGYMQTGNQESILNRSGWGEVSAIKNRRIIADINPDLILRPGPRVVEGLQQIHQRLYERRN